MGQNVGKITDGDIPKTIRKSRKLKKKECCICFDMEREGILCKTENHFICHNCFPPYVTSLIEDAGRMADNDFEINCCCPGCTAAPWSSHEVRLMLDGDLLEKYIDSLVRHLHVLDNKEEIPIHTTDLDKEDANKLINTVIDALSLGCPFCHTVIDPDPDGCAAMRCGTCSKHFCLLCLKKESNNTKCHAHVRLCPNNPSKNVYASRRIRECAHKQLKIQAVRRVLSARLGNKWRIHQHTPLVLDGVKQVLKSCDISEHEVMMLGRWEADVVQWKSGVNFWVGLGIGCLVGFVLARFIYGTAATTTCSSALMHEKTMGGPVSSLLNPYVWVSPVVSLGHYLVSLTTQVTLIVTRTSIRICQFLAKGVFVAVCAYQLDYFHVPKADIFIAKKHRFLLGLIVIFGGTIWISMEKIYSKYGWKFMND